MEIVACCMLHVGRLTRCVPPMFISGEPDTAAFEVTAMQTKVTAGLVEWSVCAEVRHVIDHAKCVNATPAPAN